jgi:CubicO group peptidase (beta-lactamase class C family)
MKDCLKPPLRLLTVLFIGFFASNVSGQTRNSFVRDSLDGYILKAMELWDIPGLAVAIVKNDTVVYSKGFGVTSLSSQQSVDSSTLFPIWSMGKSFTAFSLALLENRKQLALEDKVTKHYKAFHIASEVHEREMNIVDLLSHRIGIETFQGDFLWSESSLNTDHLLEKWSQFRPVYPIRSGFQYSNFGYLIAGKIIEQVSTKNWQTYLKEEVLDPLEMKDCRLFIQEVLKEQNVARGHSKVDGKVIEIAKGESMLIEPFGGMYANVEDISTWLRLHLNKGMLGSERLFDEAIFRKTLKPENIIGKMYLPDGSSPNVTYALGWEVRDYQNREVITHGGAYNGFLAMMGFVPQENLGFVILTNSDANELGEALKWQIIDSYTQRSFTNYAEKMYDYTKSGEIWEAQENQKLRDSVALNLPTSIPLRHFEGDYVSEIYGKIQITQEGTNTLKLIFEHHPNLTATLNHIGNNRFYCKYSQPMFGKGIFPFEVVDGKIKGFELSVHPFVEFTTYSFKKL